MYSQLIGSFERTGNFPLEANYIFATEEDLKVYFEQNAVNYQTLHKGLLKVVENDDNGQQALYWVTKAADSENLEFTKLVSASSIQELKDKLVELETKLDKEIEDRTEAIDKIYGTDDPDSLEYSNLKDISEAIKNILDRLNAVESDITNFLDIVKAIAGTEEKDVISYLQTLPYKNLTELANALNAFLTTTNPDDPTIDTFKELQAFLDGYTDQDTLKQILTDLVSDIYGDPIPSKEFRTLRGIEDFVRTFKAESENTDANLQTEINQTQIGVGLDSDGKYSADQETTYLKNATSVMNALRILDSLINDAINNTNIQVADTNTVDLTLDKQSASTTISGKVKLSSLSGNGIVAKEDGLYYNLQGDIDKGILTLKVNDNIVFQKSLGVSSVISKAYYDTDNEQLVFECTLNDGTTNTINIPVGSLIDEWEPDNSGPTNVVELNKTRVVDGLDKLTGDVRLSSNTDNILVKDVNTLLVKGTSDNIKHTDGRKVSVILDSLSTNADSLSSQLAQEISDRKAADEAVKSDVSDNTKKIATEVERSTKADTEHDTAIKNLQEEIAKKANSDNPVFTGNVVLTDTPDASDNSNKVPTTSWVNTAITNQAGEVLNTHIYDYNNPHKVTKEQLGLGNVDNTSDLDKPISTATQTALNEKAPIENPIFKGIVQVEDLIDANDSSQRVASTAWVRGVIATAMDGGSVKKVVVSIATTDDVTLGYATSIGEPIIKVYVGDTAISAPLMDVMNYFRGTNTNAINVAVSEYQENSYDTNYLISANLNLSAEQTDVVLSINEDGLSAKFEIGEYE